MNRFFCLVLILMFYGVTHAETLHFKHAKTTKPKHEFSQVDDDNPEYLKKKNRELIEKQKAYEAHVIEHDREEQKIELARVEYIRERDKNTARMPATNLDGLAISENYQKQYELEQEKKRLEYIRRRDSIKPANP